MVKLQLLFTDHSETFREGLVSLLNSRSNIKAIAVPNILAKVVKATKEHKPNILLIDIEPPECNSINLISYIHKVAPSVAIVIFTLSKRPCDIFAALRAGAIGYLSKDSNLETIIQLTTLAAEGKFIIGEPMALVIASALNVLVDYKRNAEPDHVHYLSEQEKTVLCLVAQEHTNIEIANKLFISENTAKLHVHNIMHKLHAHHRLEAMSCAILQGLWPPHTPKKGGSK